ncbi:unnamed protein product [Kuraishia capsulata CBS 1993]|uniref:NAD-dependent epimerase/dehydratase domain-containing protein n=1 Tax=Kuraishia capsulata CBS 1993 TaxID=1382522 RepID=W6MF63_9ASCO|nr:uncharacterized protein KUCA_T00000011001 [Kuraishia capsulata CBS 1993]CDK24051.1 unnamed protein product [Kuraishia capsulata CBS 1993]
MSVLVTGGTGFLALYVIDVLLESGYTVIGTARSEARYAPMLKEFEKKYPNVKLSYEIVPEIGAENAFDAVLKGHPEIKYVLHTASPVTFGLNKPLKEAYLDPAVNGTLNILKSVQKYAPQVTRVGITSSDSAVVRETTDFVHYTNQSWNTITWEDVTSDLEAYVAAKTIAEKAAWKFVKDEKPSFALTTVCPPYIFGPQLFDSLLGKTLNFSNEIFYTSATSEHTPEFLNQPAEMSVDVRDVALFHKFAIEQEATKGQRLFIAKEFFTYVSLLKLMNKHFPDIGLPKTGDAGKSPAFSFDVSNVVELVGGHDFIPLEKSVVDTVAQYVKVNGHF